MSIGKVLESGQERQMILERDEALAELNRAHFGVTVAVPCFHQSGYLTRCLESVAAQTKPAYETLVIDDGSEPDEGERISEICFDYPATRYIRVTNRKLPGARNTALMLCRTFAFLGLDADDWLEPTYIEETMPVLLAGADVVLTGLQEHGPTRNGTYMPGYDRPWHEVTARLILDDFNRFFYCSLMRTQTLREIGGYNGLMVKGLEDADVWCDLLNRGARFDAIQKPLFNYNTATPDSMLATTLSCRDEITAEMRRHHRM